MMPTKSVFYIYSVLLIHYNKSKIIFCYGILKS